MTTAGSYASANDRRAFFGIGRETAIQRIQIRWPSSIKQTVDNPRPNQFLRVVEESGANPKG